MTLETLRTQWETGPRPALLFFWGNRPEDGALGAACFSQWFPCEFTIDGQVYCTAEHWMMASKARLFGDDEILQRILACNRPKDAKALGRKVRGFDEATWRAHRTAIVEAGNLAKFGQDDALRNVLVGSGDRILVEASPYDRVWGIGLRSTDPRASDPATWQGQNLLGFALMAVRDRLAAEGADP